MIIEAHTGLGRASELNFSAAVQDLDPRATGHARNLGERVIALQAAALAWGALDRNLLGLIVVAHLLPTMLRKHMHAALGAAVLPEVAVARVSQVRLLLVQLLQALHPLNRPLEVPRDGATVMGALEIPFGGNLAQVHIQLRNAVLVDLNLLVPAPRVLDPSVDLPLALKSQDYFCGGILQERRRVLLALLKCRENVLGERLGHRALREGRNPVLVGVKHLAAGVNLKLMSFIWRGGDGLHLEEAILGLDGHTVVPGGEDGGVPAELGADGGYRLLSLRRWWERLLGRLGLGQLYRLYRLHRQKLLTHRLTAHNDLPVLQGHSLVRTESRRHEDEATSQHGTGTRVARQLSTRSVRHGNGY